MKKYLLLAILTIILVPLSGIIPIKGQPCWCPQYLALFFIFFIGIAIFLWKFNKFLSLFLLVCLYSTYFVTNGDIRAIMILTQLNFGCLASYGISKFNYKQRRYIVTAIISLVIIQVIWLGVQLLNKDPFFHLVVRSGYPVKISVDVTKNDLVAFSGAKAQMGAFFAIVSPLFCLYPILLMIPFLCIVLSKSSFAMAAILPVFISLWYLHRKIFYITSILLCIGSILFITFIDLPHLTDFKARFGVWGHSINTIQKKVIIIQNKDTTFIKKCNPIFGYGFGQFLNIFPFVPINEDFCYNYEGEKFTHAHNDYIELFFELGYSGLIVLLLLLINFIWTFIKANKTKEIVIYFSCICSFLVNALGNFPSHIAISGMLLILFYGLYKGAIREQNVKI